MEDKKLLQQLIREAGFQGLGIARIEKNSAASLRFENWIHAGFHGEMAYLKRGLEKRKNPLLVFPEARSLIALAWDYSNGGAEFISPFISRYAWGKDYHELLGAKLLKLEGKLKENFPKAQLKSYVDTGPVMEKDWAAQAGLGWVGKHTNLIDEKRGSYFFLASLLTNLEFPADFPVKDRCGTCKACIDICPTRAIVAPYLLDARLCISYLTIELKGAIPLELRKAIGSHVFGCDDCQEVCPWNRQARLPEEFLRNISIDELHEWLQLDEKKFKERFKGSPILRSKRRGFLRNVCVVLGNMGHRRSVPYLKQALEDSEPLIREHAAWALEEIENREFE